jgi:hypothetical protein
MSTALYRISKQKFTPQLTATRSRDELARTLAQLVASGLVEAFTDEHGTVRYRPTERLAA